MKKILFLLVSAFALCTSNVCATNGQQTTVAQVENNPQVCKFSLNHYRGTLSPAYKCACTANIVVMLSCPQPEDVTATVDVYVDGERVASQLFTIRAGEKSSSSDGYRIEVPQEYNGKKYVLEVE